MGVLPQALEKSSLKCKGKKNNEKITKRRISFFNLQNVIFFHFSSLWTLPTSKSSNFHISYSFKMI
jgi:hypothetical protein